MTPVRQRFLSGIAGQLGRPHGILAPLVARVLNRGNGKAIASAVEAAGVAPGAVVADLGFGGGLGLRLLLDTVGPDGVVHGVEVADDMLGRAQSRFRDDVTAGRLRLARGSLTELPLDDATLDAAITLNTVYFIPDLDAVSAELARVLRPGAKVVVGVGDPDVMRRAPFTEYGFTLRPVAEIAEAMQNSGLQVEQRHFDDRPVPRYMLVGTKA